MFRKYQAVFFFLFLTGALQAQKAFQNGQAARAVVGQSTFTAGLTTPSAQILGGASGVAVSPDGKRLYVADSNRVGATPNDHRVVVFDTSLIPGPKDVIAQQPAGVTCFVCGSLAFLGIGQDTAGPPTYKLSGQTSTTTGFYSGYNGGQDPTSTSMPEHAFLYNATAVATDGTRLVIADTDNNRILIWNSIPNSNTHPDLILGQPDFNTVQAGTLGVVTATGLRGPQGVWIQNNRLYVADTQNYRVLIWNTFPTTNNKAPDVVLGQPDFTHANAPPPTKVAPVAAANQLLNPVSVTADNNHVFVSDLGFNRVLIWNTPTPGIYQNADVVIGQTDFQGSTANNTTVCGALATGVTVNPPCAGSLNFPRFALSDGTRLFVADGGNDRVLIFNSIPTAPAAKADNVLGQTTFTKDIVSSASVLITSTTIDNTAAVDTTPTPTSLAWDGTNLYVADPFNRRVLIFTPGDSMLPSASDPAAQVIPVVNWASELVRQEGTIAISQVSGGKITANDTATVTIAGTAYVYTEKSTDTPDTIARGLVKAINAAPDPNVTAIFAGNGTQSLYLSSISANLAYDSISLSATTSNAANVTATASGSYLSAGNAATGSAGALIEVNAPPGVSFSDSTNTVTTLSGEIPKTANGVTLYLDGFASPLYKVSQKQLVGQIPYYASDRNSMSVYVRTAHNDGSVTVTNATPVYIAPANPGIFNAPSFAGQKRPWPISQAMHQLGNPTAVVSVDGSIKAADTATITIGSNSYTYTVVAADTLLSVSNSLIALINASDPNVTASYGGAFSRVVLTAKLGPFAGGNGIAVSTSTSSGANVTLTAYSAATCCAVQPGSLIFPGNPAAPGELISISTAGLGVVVDVVGTIQNQTTGAPYFGIQPNTVFFDPNSATDGNTQNNFVAATMGGQTAQVIYSGLGPGSYGIYRVDMIVPATLAANDTTPLYIAQNAFISNTVSIAVGPAVANPPSPPVPIPVNPIVAAIDGPQSDATISGVYQLSGWALDANSTIASIAVQVDGIPYGNATYGTVSRPDACSLNTGLSCPNVGYFFNLDTTTLGNAPHTVQVVITSADGHRNTLESTNVTVNNDSNATGTRLAIDSPSGAPNVTYHGVLTFSGWATNASSPVTVKGSIDGMQIPTSAFVYGGSRADACAVHSSPACPNVGWSYLADLTKLPNGLHNFSVTATAANGQVYSLTSPFTVNNFNQAANGNGPIFSIDSPSATAGTLHGTVVVGGWTVDSTSTIATVGISVDNVFFGYATYGGARSDVCAIYQNFPGCPNVGYNYALDTTFLGDGAHLLQVTVSPSAGQPFTTTRVIQVGNIATAANPVRISIDSPSATSGSLNGVVNVTGWALADNSAIQSLKVLVDGVTQGNAAYGSTRADVCAMFPGRPGCPNVGWSYSLNTAGLTNGGHALEVTATTASGSRATANLSIFVVNSPTTGHVTIDAPGPTAHGYSGIAQFSGWALDDSAAIVSVAITVDGVPVGTAAYGGNRPDVCALFPNRSGCPNVGWSFAFDTSGFQDGSHTVGVTATAANGTVTTAIAGFTVANWSVLGTVAGNIDSPSGSVRVPYTGRVIFGGWLYDAASPIKTVTVTVDGIPFGNAAYNGTRTDVCTSTAVSPNCPNVGFSFNLDTTFLSSDVHTLGVTGLNANGQSYTLTTQFNVQN